MKTMESSKGKRNRRMFFDVQKGKSPRWWDRIWAVRTLNLRPPFYRRYWFTSTCAALVLIALFLGTRYLLTRAEVEDFYPATCLGSWQSPENAQREPETFGKEGIPLSEGNSSVYGGAREEIFCGNFIPEGYEAKGEIKNAGLTLVWNIGEEDALPEVLYGSAPSSEPPPAELPPEEEDSAGASSTPSQEEEQAQPERPRGEDESAPPQSDPPSSGEPQTQEPTPPPVPEETVPSAPLPDPPSPSTDHNEPLPLAVFFPFLHWAFAQENGEAGEAAAVDAAQETSTVIIAPPLVAPLEPIDLSSSGEAETTSTIPATVPASEHEGDIAPVPSIQAEEPNEDFLQISYSADGEEWAELSKISKENWKNFTVTLPLHSWEELERLQIRIQGIPTTLSPIPKVFLDGMLVEVHYEIVTQIAELTVKEEAAAPAEPEKKEIKIFDQQAKHKCQITPFSQSVKKGAAAIYGVTLTPSSENLHFELQTGDLPTGVSAVLDSENGVASSSSTSKLMLDVSESAGNGSFDVVLIYREIDQNLNILANFCQLNLIIQ